MVAYAVIHSKAPLKASKCKAVLKGKLLGAKQKFKVPFVLDSSAAAPSLPVVHHLAAKALITDWETEEKEKKSIVDLSIESSVISSHTAFIAIDEESSEPVSGSMKTYNLRAEMCHSVSSGSYDLYCCMEEFGSVDEALYEDCDDTILESVNHLLFQAGQGTCMKIVMIQYLKVLMPHHHLLFQAGQGT